MITKEERAELRELTKTADGEWRVLSPGELVFANDATNWAGSTEREEYTVLAIAAVNAMPVLLDALDASDERIAELEAIWKLREKEHELAARMVNRRNEELKEANARIAELEAAAQWRPIEEAPKDGKDWFIVARAGTQLRGPAYWCDGRWCQGVHEELHFTPTHFCELPDALPEGGGVMISKEERAELRDFIHEVSKGSPGFPRWEYDGSNPFEQRTVEEKRHEAQFYVCEECGERKHNSNGGTDDEACDQCVEIRLLNARIAELEVAAQWRPMGTAPRDGTWILVLLTPSLSAKAAYPSVSILCFHNDPFADFWRNAHWERWKEDAGLGWLPIPALPEGGAK